ncbi:MAG: FAD-dependent monooxygenase [Alphaproteobacteria bacterium]|nr:FAD-dependent monooxygenase [Alphaproteobacteria bacterium]MCB9931197.1 FAD-dependent monooxygenase [Alphaproteobacteria bacterium]
MSWQGRAVTIIGAGIGGLALAAALSQRGIGVEIYEQATAFARVGAGIQMSPNAMRVLRGLGLEDRIRAGAFQPETWDSRDWDTGAYTNRATLGAATEARYGAPYIQMHRGDLHEFLASAVPEGIVRFGKTLTRIEDRPDGYRLSFADGTSAHAETLLGIDGVHSVVRRHLLGAEAPRFMGRAAYRTTFPARLLGGVRIDDNTKWWGPDRHIVIYYTTRTRDELYFTTSQPETDWTTESWSAEGDLAEMRAAFRGFHADVQAVLAACPRVNKWALFERDPLPVWARGAACLLGDACHPMLPYMAQGAASSLEDAAVLARCFDELGLDDAAPVFRRFEALRQPRTGELQRTSHQNTFMQRRTNPDWVYGYDAWTVPLDAAP